tara:strand:+ start:3844 stop:4599 length:756 start_codon:yes stop_codon:yes gene_type:complete
MSGFQRSVMMAMGGGIDITTTSDAENINLRTLLDAAGFDNDVPTKITYRLNSGVTLTSKAAGTNLEGPAWQTGTIGSIHTVIVYISGDIKGYGGVGGNGGSASTQQSQANGKNGGDGGDAMSFACNATLVVNSGASVLAGGGGGGGGGGAIAEDDDASSQADGGDGGRGAGTNAAETGEAGETHDDGPGPATSGAGGDGGNYGASGSNGAAATQGQTTGTGGTGGSAGYAVKKNSNTVTVTNNGTITGTQG